MCTLIVVRETGRLRVAANRDERLDRPARPPTRWTLGERVAVAPVDVQAGGTWIGVNDRGLFAAITNRFGVAHQADAPSRGRFVPLALTAEDAATAAAAVQDRAGRENGFHLVVADCEQAFELVYDGAELRMRGLPDGVTVVTERSRGAAPAPREAVITELLRQHGTEREALARVLDHADAAHPLNGVRVHAPAANYGTRSAALIELTPHALRFEHAERYPSEEAPFADYAAVVTEGFSPSGEGR